MASARTAFGSPRRPGGSSWSSSSHRWAVGVNETGVSVPVEHEQPGRVRELPVVVHAEQQ
ncbi:hypothetical protein BJF90_36725 [Pseudonocardia sp. CNS-004]|nr:hypothetical protein BJF90_36725 [Pseudonocardia sp. CNS-004]